MMYEVIITEQADNDLRGIYKYIAFDLLSQENAVAQIDRLEERILGLGEFPERFRLYEKEMWHKRGLRVMPVDHYLVFYVLDKNAGAVIIIRVLYESRDIAYQLENGTDVET